MAALYIRNIPQEDIERFKAAAAARRLSNPEFLILLIQLHERTRALLARSKEAHPNSRGLAELQRIVDELGLASVTR
jgi:hypothetical protein